MKDTSFIIKCSLPDKNAAETAINKLKKENIETDKISVYTQYTGADTLSPEIYNVPLFFGASPDTSQNVPPGSGFTPPLIMTAAVTGGKSENNTNVYFSLPVKSDDFKKAVLILKGSRAKGMKAIKV